MAMANRAPCSTHFTFILCELLYRAKDSDVWKRIARNERRYSNANNRRAFVGFSTPQKSRFDFRFESDDICDSISFGSTIANQNMEKDFFFIAVRAQRKFGARKRRWRQRRRRHWCSTDEPTNDERWWVEIEMGKFMWKSMKIEFMVRVVSNEEYRGFISHSIECHSVCASIQSRVRLVSPFSHSS